MITQKDEQKMADLTKQLSEKHQKQGWTLKESSGLMELYKNGEFVGFFSSGVTVTSIEYFIDKGGK
jgi:hypothetical protein